MFLVLYKTSLPSAISFPFIFQSFPLCRFIVNKPFIPRVFSGHAVVNQGEGAVAPTARTLQKTAEALAEAGRVKP